MTRSKAKDPIKAGIYLRESAKQGNVDNVITVLAKNPALLDEKCGAVGWSALHKAADKGHTPVVSLLIDHGCSIDVLSNYKNTPLMFSTKYPPVVELLLNTGKCDINAQNVYGWTTLMFAAREGLTTTARLLLLRGADFSLRSTIKYGNNDALTCAQKHGHTEIVSLIEKEGCWRRRRAWVMFSSMLKVALMSSSSSSSSSLAAPAPAPAPIPASAPAPVGVCISTSAVMRALAMDEITRLVASWL